MPDVVARRCVAVGVALATGALVPGAWAGSAPVGPAGTTTLVSIGWDGEPTNNASKAGPITDDGRFVAFSSGSDQLVEGDTNERWDVSCSTARPA